MVSVSEAAAAKGLSRQAILKAISTNRLPAKKYGEQYLIRRADLDAWTPAPRGPKRRERDESA